MATWVSLLASHGSEQVDLALPRFESSDETELSMTLSGLGMKKAFSAETANFSGMRAEGVRDPISSQAVI